MSIHVSGLKKYYRALCETKISEHKGNKLAAMNRSKLYKFLASDNVNLQNIY